MSSKKTGTSMNTHYSFRAKKRAKNKAAAEEKLWKSQNGSVKVRKATQEELERFREPP